VPVHEAKISVYDIGITRGYGIYESIKTYRRKPFFLRQHLDRFRSSVKATNLKIPVSDTEIAKIIDELVEKNGYPETNIRMILTGGQTLHGIEYDFDHPTFFILAEPNSQIDKKFYEEGCTLMTFEHQRLYPAFKTTNYITAVNLQPLRKEKGALEILYTWQGKILECATSNFFLFQGDTLVTPKNNVLLGITRMAVIASVASEFKVEERDVLIQEFDDASEAFLTATYKEVVPVVRVDDKKIGNGTVGNRTKKVMELFRECTEQVSL